jgi:hypothetical protein
MINEQAGGINKGNKHKADADKKADKMQDERVPGQGSDGNNETRSPEEGGSGSGVPS